MKSNTESQLIMRLRAIFIAAIITACFVMASLTGMAANNPNALALKVNRERLSAEISHNIAFPAFVTTNSVANEVKAIVEVDTDGRINVHEISTANPELKNYVNMQLQKMQLSNHIPTGAFVLVLKFRVL